jgi:hypothetical protein
MDGGVDGSGDSFSFCKFFGEGTGHIMKPHARVDFSHVRQADTRGGLTLARIRITLDDDDGREINRDKEDLYDLSLETKRLVDIEAAVEAFK